MGGIRLRGMGHCVPEHVVTNDDLAQRVDTCDEWIASRTGIRRRHYCTTESQADLCVRAAMEAMRSAGISGEQVGVCIVATMSPENLMPSTACVLQQALGLPGDTLCFDLNAACSGFIFAMHTMECLLAASERKVGLLVGAEALSRLINWADRSTCILFGDGAGAAVVEWKGTWASIGAVVGCDGQEALLAAPGPGSLRPSLISMDGPRVFKFAVETVSSCMDQVLARHGATAADVDFFVFHQANARIIDLVARKHGIEPEKVVKNLAEYGNTSAASIPLALSELHASGKVSPGSRILIVGFGGGLTWGGAMVQFA